MAKTASVLTTSLPRVAIHLHEVITTICAIVAIDAMGVKELKYFRIPSIPMS